MTTLLESGGLALIVAGAIVSVGITPYRDPHLRRLAFGMLALGIMLLIASWLF